MFAKVPVNLAERQFVAALKPPVIVTAFLDSVIGKVDHAVLKVVQCELLGAGPDVALVIPVGSDFACD